MMALIVGFMLVFSLIGCDTGNEPTGGETHTHSYSATWSKNATQHWKECSCGDKTQIANHTFSGDICSVCSYDKSTGGGSLGTWTRVENPAFSNVSVSGIAYGGNKFVAVGYNRQIAYSADGISWTAVANTGFTTTQYGNNNIFDIAYGNGKFVAVGGSNQMAYSTDGINWTAVANTAFLPSTASGLRDATDISCVAYGNGKFVAGGVCASDVNRNEWGAQLAYSTDGINWTAVDATIFGFSSTIHRAIITVEFVNDRFVATTELNDGILGYSTDGINWTLGGSPLPTGIDPGSYYQVLGIAYGAGKYVVGGTDKYIAYSTNCVNWKNGNEYPLGGSVGSTPNVRAITFANGKFIAVGYYNSIAQSTDGTSWTKFNNVPLGGTVNTGLYDVAYGVGKFVAVGYTGSPAVPVIMYCND
jgi:hypothetical protein